MFHTQEDRGTSLTLPVKCIQENAWLGDGYYFWDDIDDANRWGRSHKKTTGMYQIYEAEINCDNVLDTVFNEEHYRFWIEQVELAASAIKRIMGYKPSLKEINAYFKERATWDDVEGIRFQDVPTNNNYTLVTAFYYKKRIQLVVFDLRIIRNFSLLYSTKC